MRLTWKNVTESWGPQRHRIRVNGFDVGSCQQCRSGGWFWYARGDELGVPIKNTCDTPVPTLEEAKRECEAHIRECLSKKEVAS